MPKLSGRAAQIMNSSAKKNKKRNENEYRSQGLLEVQEILDDHDSKYGSAIGDQLGMVKESQEEIKLGSGAWDQNEFVVIFSNSFSNFQLKYD